MDNSPVAVTIADIAKRFSVSPRTVRRWIARGMPYLQAAPGTKVLVDPNVVRHFLVRQFAPLEQMVEMTVRELGMSKDRQ